MTHTWHPQPLPVTVQLSPVGRWMPAPASVDRSPSIHRFANGNDSDFMSQIIEMVGETQARVRVVEVILGAHQIGDEVLVDHFWSVGRPPGESETFVRDVWSDDPDRTTRRGMC